VSEYEAWVADLAVPHRAKAAWWSLFRSGWDAQDAVRAGLSHESADVRLHCVRYFDHYLTPETLDDLIGLLEDPDPGVKCAILHTLACDRCKEGDCRPSQAAVLPAALELLASDPSPHVRAMAVECVGAYVHVSDEAESALMRSASSDGAPAVRKKAGWFAPGGTVYARTRPKPARHR
jgi:HEAT repeat protein